MKTALVLTAVGDDRPGLVQMISDAVADLGGNWEASRMARLGGKFAGMALVTFPSGEPAGLRDALAALGGRGLSVSISDASSSSGERAAELASFSLELVANDRPGILREISKVLAAKNVNLDELGTSCDSAPMAGGELFRLRALLAAPPQLDIAELKSALEALSAELMIELDTVD